MAEITTRRTYTSKTHELGGGVFEFEAHGGHIHYKDTQDNFQEVDFALTDEGTYWSMDKASYRLYIAKDFGASQLIRFDNRYEGANHSIYYEPHSIQWVHRVTHDRIPIRTAQSVIGVLSGNKIIYTNAFGNGINFEITLRRTGFKKEIVIPNQLPLNPPSSDYVLVVLFKYEVTGLTVKSIDSTQEWDNDSYYESEEGFSIREAVQQYKSYIRKAYIKDNSRHPQRRKLKVFWERRNGVLWQAKVLPINWMQNATYPIRADTTTSYYSNTGGDGWVYVADTVWDTIHDALSGTEAQNDSIKIFNSYWPANYIIYRGFVPFDTSGIPDAATISAATLYLYCTAYADDENAAQSYITLVQTTQADPTDLNDTDYDLCGDSVDNPTEGCDVGDRLDLTGLTTSNWETVPLNATGLGWINKAGYTMLGLRGGWDTTDTPYPGSNEDDGAVFNDTEDVANDPYLSVTYSTGYTLALDAGSISVSGIAMTPQHDKVLALDTKAIAVAGGAMTPQHDKTLVLATRAIAVNGMAMTPQHDKRLALATRAITVSGVALAIVYNKTLSLESGGISIIGRDVLLEYSAAAAFYRYRNPVLIYPCFEKPD